MAVIHKYRGDGREHDWEGVAAGRYVISSGHDASKRVLIGPDDGSRNFAVRYFEIAPGAETSEDVHDHDHGVVVVRGRAELVTADGTDEIGLGDALYIAPREPHRFRNTGDEPFGFLCVIPPKSDGTA